MFNKFITQVFLNTGQEYSQNNAFCINDEYFSYKQFIQRIAVIAKSLQNVPESSIAIVANDDLDTYASIFAIWFSGKMYVPLNPDTPVERNQNIIDQVGIKTVLNSIETGSLASQDFETSINALKSYTYNSDFDSQLAYIFFTSGSTGIPKGVMISKKNVASFVEAFWAMGYDIQEDDRWLQMFELTFDLSVISFLIPLLKGACVYTIPKNKIKYSYSFELMDEKKLTVALMVPSILNYLRPYFEEIDCPQMKYSLFCGEALHNQIVEEWANCIPNARIDNVYGPTEDTIFCTYYTFQRNGENDSYNGILSIGKPMLNNLTVIFNDANKQTAFNEIGELCLGGAQLTPGYFNNELLNQEMFFTAEYEGVETRFYRSGDLCMLRENGNIDYIGRKDSQVKIQGFRVELSEVEFHVKKAINGQYGLVATVIQNQAGNNEIAVVFESEEFDLNDTKTNLKTKMPSYMVPTQYYFLKLFPLNVNGKIDRKAIAKKIQEKVIRCVLFGEDIFTATVLQDLLKHKMEVLWVVCPLYQNNNHKKLQSIAEQHKIEFSREYDVNAGSVKDNLLKIKPDLIISVHLRKILSKSIFSIAKQGAINVHPSLLPKYRGLSPQHQPIIHGDSESGVTVHFIDESVDTGNIIVQEIIPIENGDYISDFQLKMLDVYKNIVNRAIECMADKNFIPVKQQKDNISYFGSLKEKDREIDFSKSKTDALNLIRAVSYPYKGAYYDNYTIWRVEMPNESESEKYMASYSQTGIYVITEELLLLRFNDGVLLSDDFETSKNIN